jgi:hypothetical protein
MRLGLLVGLLLVLQPTAGWAEWQLKPFVGVTFGGTTTFLDLDRVADERKKFVLGGSATWLGNFIGVEGDVARVPGFFQTASQQLVLSSSVTTLTGNVVLTLPRKMTQYRLRPYFVAGGGVVGVNVDDEDGIFDIRTSLRVLDFGGGATGFLTDRVGVNWDVRYFRSVGGKEDTGLTIGKEQVSFWRATMGVAIRLGATRGTTP